MQTATREITGFGFVPMDVNVQECQIPQAERRMGDQSDCLGDFDCPVDLSVNPALMERSSLTHEEIWDDFCKKLGRHYGLADIRDAR